MRRVLIWLWPYRVRLHSLLVLSVLMRSKRRRFLVLNTLNLMLSRLILLFLVVARNGRASSLALNLLPVYEVVLFVIHETFHGAFMNISHKSKASRPHSGAVLHYNAVFNYSKLGKEISILFHCYVVRQTTHKYLSGTFLLILVPQDVVLLIFISLDCVVILSFKSNDHI